jgi:hypothetical protein
LRLYPLDETPESLIFKVSNRPIRAASQRHEERK